ncbi:MAG: hypothetical protein ACREID_02660, partial [Planctomycetota bacterium]
MNDVPDRLEEYADDLLSGDERRDADAALTRDPALRRELEEVRRFAALLEGVRESAREERAVRRILSAVGRLERRRAVARVLLALAGAALIVLALRPRAPEPPANPAAREVVADWVVYGKRLGALAAERRAGRV